MESRGDRVLAAAVFLALLVFLCSHGDGGGPAKNRASSCLLGNKLHCAELKLAEQDTEILRLRQQLSQSRWNNLELRARMLNTGTFVVGAVIWTAIMVFWSIEQWLEKRHLERVQDENASNVRAIQRNWEQLLREREQLFALRRAPPKPSVMEELEKVKEEKTGLIAEIDKMKDMLASLAARFNSLVEDNKAALSSRESKWQQQLEEAFSRIRCLKEEVLEESMKLFEEEEDHKTLKTAYNALETELAEIKAAWQLDRDELSKMKTTVANAKRDQAGPSRVTLSSTSGTRKAKRALDNDGGN